MEFLIIQKNGKAEKWTAGSKRLAEDSLKEYLKKQFNTNLYNLIGNIVRI